MADLLKTAGTLTMAKRERVNSETVETVFAAPSEKILLPEACREISKLLHNPVAYSRLYAAVLSAEVEATKSIRGWLVERSNLPKIAEHFRRR